MGSFTVDGKETDPKQDRYSITKATKLKGNTWAIHARIKYGEVDITVPVAVQVDWAKDTPILAVTDLKIPDWEANLDRESCFTATAMPARGSMEKSAVICGAESNARHHLLPSKPSTAEVGRVLLRVHLARPQLYGFGVLAAAALSSRVETPVELGP